MNKQEILEEVANLETQTGSLIDAIVEVCERHSIDIETIARYIKYSKDMKERIRQEGVVLNMIKTDDAV